MEPLSIEEIQKVLPQRYPFLLIDRVLEIVPGQKVVAIKNISINEGFFSGHFPANPIMPGALILEAMAQASIFLYHSGYEKELNKTPEYYLGSIKARFKNPAYPGDQLRLVAQTDKLLATGAFVTVKALVGETEIAEAELVFAVKR